MVTLATLAIKAKEAVSMPKIEPNNRFNKSTLLPPRLTINTPKAKLLK